MPACFSSYQAIAAGRQYQELAIHDFAQYLAQQLRQSRTAPDLAELDADENGANDDAAQDPYSEYVNGVEREPVRSAIQELPLEFREIIILREYEKFSYQEIAAARLPSGYSHVAAGNNALQTPRLAFGPDDSFLVRPPRQKGLSSPSNQRGRQTQPRTSDAGETM